MSWRWPLKLTTLVLLGACAACSQPTALSTKAPPTVICGTTLSDSAAGAYVQDASSGAATVSHVSVGGDTEQSGGMPADVDWVSLVRESKPLIAAVNGAAVGIGMTMILPFDVIVASERAKFGMLFIKVGLVPELASTRLLVQRVGFGGAAEMCLSGNLYDGAEAHRIGLADRLTPHEELVDETLELASQIATNPAPQLRMIKRLLTENAVETDLELVQEREHELIRECWRSPEHRQAVDAFLAKAR